MRRIQSVLVTGGAGFIGANFLHYLFGPAGFDGRVVNLDKLTYAGNPENLADLERSAGGRYRFVRGDVGDFGLVRAVLRDNDVDTVVHFAAESHVDRSIHGPGEFIQTNIVGTFTLLEAVREYWQGRDGVLFHHVSTDEVYGSLGDGGYFVEDTPYDPRSPYSASKAASDHLVMAYRHTYGLPVTLSNCSNNYGPYQFPEKLIPLMILNIREGKPLPVYGDGKNIRDWLYVDDHNAAVWAVLNRGKTGETYNVGGENEWENLRLVHVLCEKMAQRLGTSPDACKSLIAFVKDRPGHDRRYAINCDKIKRELGWRQTVDFDAGLEKTIDWYLEHPAWIDRVRSGAYRQWMEKNYGQR